MAWSSRARRRRASRRRSHQPDMEPSGSAAEAPDETARSMHGIGDEQHSMELDGAAASSGPQTQPDGQRGARQDDGKAGTRASRGRRHHDKYAAKARAGTSRET